MTGRSLQQDHIDHPVCRWNSGEDFRAVGLQELKGLGRGTLVSLLKAMISGVQSCGSERFYGIAEIFEVGYFLLEVIISRRTEKFSVKFFLEMEIAFMLLT